MGWKVIKDKVHTEEKDGMTLEGREYDDYQGGKHRWRLLDADDVVYLYLLSDCDPNDCYEEEGFAPLDWAMPRYGCTDLQYKDKDGEYKTL
jgi:hypothetical protein